MEKDRDIHLEQFQDKDFVKLSGWAKLLTLGVRNFQVFQEIPEPEFCYPTPEEFPPGYCLHPAFGTGLGRSGRLRLAQFQAVVAAFIRVAPARPARSPKQAEFAGNEFAGSPEEIEDLSA